MFNKVINRKQSKSLKWDDNVLIERFGDKDVLPLWVADMDFEAAPAIKEAILKEVENGSFGYTVKPNTYYEAIVAWYKKRFDFQLETKWIVDTPGIVTALGYALDAFLKKGDHVLIQEPVYFPFKMMIENHNLVKVNNPLTKDEMGYHIDFEDFEKKVKNPNVKMFVLCSPHNPIGKVWSKEDLIRMADLCLENNVLIFADEIHHDLVYKSVKHHILVNLDKKYHQHVLTATSPSKTFNLAGMQTSHMIIPGDELRKTYENLLERAHLAHPNPLSTAAVEGAYSQCEPWLESALDHFEMNIKVIEKFLKENLPKAKFDKPQGTYLAWIDLSAYEVNDEVLQEKLIKKGKIALNKGTMFGQGGHGYVRLNFACPEATLIKGLEGLKKALEE